MISSILQTATRVLMPLLLLFAVFLLLRGHNAPGGGFVGGLVVSAAFILHATAYGVEASRRVLMIDASTLLGIGLSVALGSALPSALVGRPFMSALWGNLGRGDAGVPVGTPLVFDVGVFLAVIGVVLTIAFMLIDVASQEE